MKLVKKAEDKEMVYIVQMVSKKGVGDIVHSAAG